MTIHRLLPLLALTAILVLMAAACGGNGDDGDGSGEAFQLPPAGEYSFEVTGTIEVQFFEEAVSAGPVTLQETQTGEVSGSLTIQFADDGSFTVSGKDGLLFEVKEIKEGPITFTQNESEESSGTISGAGMTIELNVLAELSGGLTATHEQPFLLEGDGDPFSDEGVTLSTPPDAEAVNFVSADETDPRLAFGITALFIGLFGGFGFDEGDDLTPTATSTTDTEEPDEPVLESTDPPDDATDCATGESVVDPAVEIEAVNVQKEGENIVVEVITAQSPETSFEDFSSGTVVTLGDFGALADIHAGLRQEGLTDSAGSIIPGTEDLVTWTDGGVSFAFPDDGSIPKGSLLEVETFHLEIEGGDVHCDTFTDVYNCFGRCDD